MSENLDTTDDIFGINEYAAEMPTETKEFLPWHRPRKQYVRHYQWCREILRMFETQMPQDGTLKYLGLPGVDLLDIRHLHTAVCLPNSLKMRFLGFNNCALPSNKKNAELNVSLDEVRRLENVDGRSDVIGYDFSLLGNPASVAYHRARQLGPFDVINIDLCDGFGSKEPGILNNNYYDAINCLMALQARTANPWILFLTTRIDSPNIHADLLKKLLKKYIANLNDHPPFRAASKEHFRIDTEEEAVKAADDPIGMAPIFLTGLCKWLISLAIGYHPPHKPGVLSIIGYRVAEGVGEDDLISLAIKFTPTFIPANDTTGISTRTMPPLDEGTIATRAVKTVSARINVDKRLADNNGELFEEMKIATKNLLKLARYDLADYERSPFSS